MCDGPVGDAECERLDVDDRLELSCVVDFSLSFWRLSLWRLLVKSRKREVNLMEYPMKHLSPYRISLSIADLSETEIEGERERYLLTL